MDLLTIGAVVVLIAAVIYGRLRKQRARKALLERLAAKGTALSPYAEFHKTLRQLTRKHPDKPEEYVEQLDASFRYFLTREFIIPADEWPTAVVLKDLKKPTSSSINRSDRNFQLAKGIQTRNRRKKSKPE
jgi:hypothetical protein